MATILQLLYTKKDMWRNKDKNDCPDLQILGKNAKKSLKYPRKLFI